MSTDEDEPTRPIRVSSRPPSIVRLILQHEPNAPHPPGPGQSIRVNLAKLDGKWVAVAECRDMIAQSEKRETPGLASAEAVNGLVRYAEDLGRGDWF